MSPPLKWLSALVLILLAYSGSACTPLAEGYTDLETRTIDPAEAQAVLIQVDVGEVQILQSPDPQIHVQGQTLSADELDYEVDSAHDPISIRISSHHAPSSRPPLLVNILLPPKLKVRVETQAASILAQGFQGDLEITSTSGKITVEKITGQMALHSNRGSITIRDSSGIVSVVGNYGALTAQNVRGDVGLSTIMGNIVFNGAIGGDDSIRLETDHGSVSVNFSVHSDLTLQVRTTSGNVACLLQGIASSTRTCDGQIASGNGRLWIRTVSGDVTVQTLP